MFCSCTTTIVMLGKLSRTLVYYITLTCVKISVDNINADFTFFAVSVLSLLPRPTYGVFYFYPRGARDARVLVTIACRGACVCVCMSVCVQYNTRRYCIKNSKCRITQTTPRDSPGDPIISLEQLNLRLSIFYTSRLYQL